MRCLERGEMTALEAIDILLSHEYGNRESRRFTVGLKTSRLMPMKTLEGFDFSFQPSLDRGRILALAQLDFIERGEVVHLLGPPGTGKSHLATALGAEAVRAGKRVYRASLAEVIDMLVRAERDGRLPERLRFFNRNTLLIVDEIGYLPVTPGGANLFFQLVNSRYEKGAMILTSNRGFAEWGEVFGDPVVATALLDRGRKLPLARSLRPRARAHQSDLRHHPAAAAKKTRAATKGAHPRSLERLITENPNWGILTRHFWGNFSQR
jgi:DNA replication protein DnaC